MPVRAEDLKLVRRGMTKEDVRAALGEPHKTFRQTADWMYLVELADEPYWYVSFDDQDCVDGARPGVSIGGVY